MTARRSRGRPLAGLVVVGLWLGGCAVVPQSRTTVERGPSEVTGFVQRVTTTADDTLIELAREYDLGYIELVIANPEVDPWLPGEGEIILPTAYVLPPGPREGIVVNLAEQRLFLFREGEAPVTFPIGVGRDGFVTPTGSTKVVRKKANPTWYPGPSARADDPTLGRAVGPGPDNPLGTHAIYLGWPAYLIHGTNKPYGIGRPVSRGCIRLYPEDIVKLFELVDVGVPVRVINEPIKIGWMRGELFVEVHPTLANATEIEESGSFVADAIPDIREDLLAVAGEEAARVDWDRVRDAVTRRHGIPVQVTRRRVEDPFAPLRGLFGRIFSTGGSGDSPSAFAATASGAVAPR